MCLLLAVAGRGKFQDEEVTKNKETKIHTHTQIYFLLKS